MAAMEAQPQGLIDEASFWQEQRDAFAVVQGFLDGSIEALDARDQMSASCGLQRRLIDAINGFGTAEAGPADVAALLASVLRREGSRQGREGSPPRLTASGSNADRLRSISKIAGLGALTVGSSVVFTAKRWEPAWLAADPLDAVDALELRRLNPPAPAADTFFREALGYSTYATVGQEIAARSVELSGDGSTILVSLPTGNGKSAVGLFGALRPGVTGTTVVVVPTVSLARDQEAHLCDALDRGCIGRALLHRDFAHLGGGDDTAKAEIRARILEGKQGVIFLAPESLRGLARTLSDAAREGLLTDFVVDEAHTVLGWGTDFRPDFQTIAGVRRGLLEACPEGREFRTILLSATITDHAAAVLRRLFGAESPQAEGFGIDYTSVEGALRPEPTYFVAECADEDERTARVLEAVHVLPRPAIVYVTNPAHAESLVAAMREVGFFRVESYTGRTNNRTREAVEAGWRDKEGAPTRYDLVVATSAFGLGIDQPDVRAVVHAYTPETASRFYQEVGRGGRDGRACLSLLLTNRRDLQQCRKLALAVYPGPIVRSRWNSMFHNRLRIEGDRRVWVDLDDVRPQLRAQGVRPGNLRNRGWNQRVLTLLQDARLITLDTPAAAASPAAFHSPVGIRLIRADMLEPEWDAAWESARRRGSADAAADFAAMQSILQHRQCIAEEIAARFEIDINGVRRRPSPTCHGCPWCRAREEPAWTDRPWTAAAAQSVVRESERVLSDLLQVASGGVVAVVADSAQTPSVVSAAINLSRARGVVLAARAELRSTAYVADRRRPRPGLADENGLVPWSSIPGVLEVIVSPTDAAMWLLDPAQAVLRVLIVSRDTPSPLDPHRSLAEMRPVPVLYAEQFLTLVA